MVKLYEWCNDMKIMSFNTQHCLSFVDKKIDFEIMARAILDLGADVVGLNEMRGQGTDPEYTAQVERLAELCGMKYYYFAKAIDVKNKGPYGNGILSKIPILNAEVIPIPDPPTRISGHGYETRCILKAELEGGITVLVTHFGLNPDEQENAVKMAVESLSEQKCILMGDFNVTPENSVLEPIQSRMNDTADKLDSEKLSFPSDEPKKKIDYIFVSKDIAVFDADIPSVVASDHRPHIATIRV